MKFNFKKSDYLLYAIIVAIIIVVFFVLPKGFETKDTLSLTKDQSQVEYAENQSNQNANDAVSESNKPKGISPASLIVNFISVAILVFFIYLLYKRTKGEDLAFIFILIRKNKTTKKKYLQVTIYNLGKYSLGINAPTLEFYHKSKVKKYTITKVENQVIYPLTVPIKQGHRLNINFEKFYLNIPDLKKFKTLKVTYVSMRGKMFRSNKAWVS